MRYIPIGNYIVVETRAPEGYEISDKTVAGFSVMASLDTLSVVNVGVVNHRAVLRDFPPCESDFSFWLTDAWLALFSFVFLGVLGGDVGVYLARRRKSAGAQI